MGLRALLLAERAISRQLLALAAQEREALVASDTATLQRVVARQEALARRWAALEQQRLAALAPYALRLELPAEQMTLDAVLPLLPPADAQALAELQATLRAEMAELQRAQAVNRALIERALENVTSLLDLMRGVQTTPTRYARSGAVQTAAPVAVLDRRA